MDSEPKPFTIPTTGIGPVDPKAVVKFFSAQYLSMEMESNKDNLVTLCYLIVTIDSWLTKNAQSLHRIGTVDDYPEKYISSVLTNPAEGTHLTDAITELKNYAGRHSINLKNTRTDLDGTWDSWKQSNKIHKGKLAKLKANETRAARDPKISNTQGGDSRRPTVLIKATVWSSKHGYELENSKHRSQIICEVPDLFALGNVYNIIRYAGLRGYNVHNPNSGRKLEENLKLKLAPQAMIYSESVSNSQNWSLIPATSKLGELSYHRENLQVLKAKSTSIALAVVVQSTSHLPKRIVFDKSKMRALQTLINAEIKIADVQVAIQTQEFESNRILRIVSRPHGPWKITAPPQESLPPPPRPPSGNPSTPNPISPTLNEAQHGVRATGRGSNGSGAKRNGVQSDAGNPNLLNPTAQRTLPPARPRPEVASSTAISAQTPESHGNRVSEAPVKSLHPNVETMSSQQTRPGPPTSAQPILNSPTPEPRSLTAVSSGHGRPKVGRPPHVSSRTAGPASLTAPTQLIPALPLPAKLSTSASATDILVANQSIAAQHQSPSGRSHLSGSSQISDLSEVPPISRGHLPTSDTAPNRVSTDPVGERSRQTPGFRSEATPPTLGVSPVTTPSVFTSVVDSSSVTATRPSTPASSQLPPSIPGKQEPPPKLGWVRRLVKKFEDIMVGPGQDPKGRG